MKDKNQKQESVEEVLNEIFRPNVGMTEDYQKDILQPSLLDINKLAEIIGKNGREEDLQQEIANRPAFLTGFFPMGGQPSSPLLLSRQ